MVRVEWESTGRESTENAAYLTPVFRRITVHEVSTTAGRVLRLVAYVTGDLQGERVVIEKWRTPDGRFGRRAGTITYRRITGPDTAVEDLEPERVVTDDELSPDIAELL
ncbi:hypothetical protein IAG44_39990 [Streptomyces roseirectus]|uniref:Uncharacterized protein n=1 Tax=Streptomyces roseirectus TaxID=2768066 RepID=A0A7H0IQC8_9ACTN|nr:hypothetical protein [Streptomyces roseirectus]QNP74994.1 hypothetical protein IAG44_39990 [Streptomyces roseirectus]